MGGGGCPGLQTPRELNAGLLQGSEYCQITKATVTVRLYTKMKTIISDDKRFSVYSFNGSHESSVFHSFLKLISASVSASSGPSDAEVGPSL